MKRVLVYGAKGALGSTCVSHFVSNNWWVAAVDLKDNTEAHVSLAVKSDNMVDQEKEICKLLTESMNGSKLDALICVAGGWVGGNAASNDFLANNDSMIQKCVWSSCIAASVATKFMNEGGLLVLTGAKAALESTPQMIAYGLSKAAVHQLTTSLAGSKSGMPNNSTVLAILPITLDTPMNRKFMPKADTTKWTSLTFIAETFLQWSNSEPQNRPKNGSLLSLITENNQTTLKEENFAA